MRQHRQPYLPKKIWKKMKISPKFEREIVFSNGCQHSYINLVLQTSDKPCQDCHENREGRVLKVCAVKKIECFIDHEPILINKKFLKKIRNEILGYSYCPDCFPGK